MEEDESLDGRGVMGEMTQRCGGRRKAQRIMENEGLWVGQGVDVAGTRRTQLCMLRAASEFQQVTRDSQAACCISSPYYKTISANPMSFF